MRFGLHVTQKPRKGCYRLHKFDFGGIRCRWCSFALAMLGLMVVLPPTAPAFAHPGGFDSSGCHNDRKRGGYHCHQRREAPAPVALPAPVRIDPPRPLGFIAPPAPAPQAPAASSPPTRVGAVEIVASGTPFLCTPVLVWDGDGPVWCAEGPHVRIAGVAAREMDESCRPGHPCPDASGRAARDALVNLFGGSRGETRTGHVLVEAAPLACVSTGWAKGNRTAARCTLPDGRSLGEALIAAGVASAWDYAPPAP